MKVWRRSSQRRINYSSKKLKIYRKLIIYRLVLSLFFLLPVAVLAGDSKDGSILSRIDRSKAEKIVQGNRLITEIKPLKEDKPQLTELEKTNLKKLGRFEHRLEKYVPPKEPIKILATGYSSTVDQCDSDPFTTASGTTVHKGTIACPPQYPFGAKVKIDGLGTFVCEDRGGKIYGNHFDIWFETRAEAISWGKRIVLAKIEK